MKGDFTRFDFDSSRHFRRVFCQQGRVTLDSDANESTDIFLHHLRTLSRDLFGRFGGPRENGGFSLWLDTSTQPPQLVIGAGHYYVDGILCEVDTDCDYANQPDYVPVPLDSAGNGDQLLGWLRDPGSERFWVYLDVWERHVTWIEDDRVRENALGGSDTCTRSKVIWQVKALPWNESWATGDCAAPLVSQIPLSSARLAARVDRGKLVNDLCIVSPDARYRGTENQLYRVEIHRGGDASEATFKWSRDNGSVATRWLRSEGDALIVANSRGFDAGDWVELSHDALELAGLPGQLVRLAKVEGEKLLLSGDVTPFAHTENLVNPKVRRWNQRGNEDTLLFEGAVQIVEASIGDPGWIDLEDGVQIQFTEGGDYRTGDYWTIRASVATGDIEWPKDDANHPLPREPQGIRHHYAPLGILSNDGGLQVMPCRRCLDMQVVPCPEPNISHAVPRRERGPKPSSAARRSSVPPSRRKPKPG
jgi:hypothetical protein